MKPIKLKIKDIEWSFQVQSDLDYEKEHGKDSHGITHKDEKKVFFKESSFDLHLIRHELFHVYASSCCLDSATDISADDFEEISAEIVAYHADDLLKHAKKLYNSLNEEIKKYKEE